MGLGNCLLGAGNTAKDLCPDQYNECVASCETFNGDDGASWLAGTGAHGWTEKNVETTAAITPTGDFKPACVGITVWQKYCSMHLTYNSPWSHPKAMDVGCYIYYGGYNPVEIIGVEANNDYHCYRRDPLPEPSPPPAYVDMGLGLCQV
jgi:hypothetical protein